MQVKSKLTKIYRPDWTKGLNRDEKKLWLNKNENSDEVLAKKVKKMLGRLNRNIFFGYPNLAPLYHKLSKKLKVNSYNLLLTAGSDAGIKTVFETFIREKDLVLRTNPTFAMYGVYSKIFKVKEILLNYHKTNFGPKIYIRDIINLIQKRKPKLLCLPNPDSPTGHCFLPNEIEFVLRKAKAANCLVLIDEAYYPFYPFSCKKFIKKYSNLIVIRTTAKAWGIAGMRVGYVISSKRIIKEMHKVKPMYEINNVGAELFKQFLDRENLMKSSVKRLMKGKAYFKNELIKLNFKVFKKEEGNFINVNFNQNRKKITDQLKKNVYFREVEDHESLKNFSRFTITSKKNFKKIIFTIRKCLQKK